MLISASWLNPHEMKSFKIVSNKLRGVLDDAELVEFSRIVILSQDDPVVSYLQKLETTSNGRYKELNTEKLSNKFNFTIKQGILFYV